MDFMWGFGPFTEHSLLQFASIELCEHKNSFVPKCKNFLSHLFFLLCTM